MYAQIGDYIWYCRDPGEYVRNNMDVVKDTLAEVVDVRTLDDGFEEYVTSERDIVSETELDLDDILLPSEAHEGHL